MLMTRIFLVQFITFQLLLRYNNLFVLLLKAQLVHTQKLFICCLKSTLILKAN